MFLSLCSIKLLLVVSRAYFLDTLYRVILQVLGISQSKLTGMQKITINIISLTRTSECILVSLYSNESFLQVVVEETTGDVFPNTTIPAFSIAILVILVREIFYQAFDKQNKRGNYW